jgi:hypothetical protein
MEWKEGLQGEYIERKKEREANGVGVSGLGTCTSYKFGG